LIERMKFLSITGPQEDIDRIVNDYISKYEIHLENALSELQSVKNLTPFIQINPYKEHLNKAKEFCSYLPSQPSSDEPLMPLEDAISFIEELDKEYMPIKKQLDELNVRKANLSSAIERLLPFRSFHYNLSNLKNYEFIRFRFGRISKEHYGKFLDYVYGNYDTYFYPCGEDDSYIWGLYFCPRSQLKKIDAVYSSMHFEVVFLPDEYQGLPEEALDNMNKLQSQVDSDIDTCQKNINQFLGENKDKMLLARDTLDSFSENFDVRKLAACTRSDDFEVFYILCGWMTEDDIKAFSEEIKNDENLYCFIESDEENLSLKPPTKLNNPKVFRPFEMFIRMYGLPAYNEVDPTIFVSLTYAFIFGAMFGDAGQGLCLMLGGFLLYHFKKIDLAAIIGTAGIFSTLFGFMYGSFFGFEHVIPAIWLRPMESLIQVPFVGKLNTVFIVAIAFGMFIIMLSMVIHIINAVKAKDIENIWFDQNAVAGLVFYGSLIATIVLFATGHTMPATIILLIMFVLPLIIIFLKEPLTRLIEKKAGLFPDSVGMFFVQGFFELFEILLSYFSNTLSFVRIGAFALSHAAMMQVVLTLAGGETSGHINWIVVILGNLFVCGMEGLVVGIQVLRLEYYEIFSRFYKGTGVEFSPFLKHKHRKGGHTT